MVSTISSGWEIYRLGSTCRRELSVVTLLNIRTSIQINTRPAEIVLIIAHQLFDIREEPTAADLTSLDTRLYSSMFKSDIVLLASRRILFSNILCHLSQLSPHHYLLVNCSRSSASPKVWKAKRGRMEPKRHLRIIYNCNIKYTTRYYGAV